MQEYSNFMKTYVRLAKAVFVANLVIILAAEILSVVSPQPNSTLEILIKR